MAAIPIPEPVNDDTGSVPPFRQLLLETQSNIQKLKHERDSAWRDNRLLVALNHYLTIENQRLRERQHLVFALVQSLPSLMPIRLRRTAMNNDPSAMRVDTPNNRQLRFLVIGLSGLVVILALLNLSTCSNGPFTPIQSAVRDNIRTGERELVLSESAMTALEDRLARRMETMLIQRERTTATLDAASLAAVKNSITAVLENYYADKPLVTTSGSTFTAADRAALESMGITLNTLKGRLDGLSLAPPAAPVVTGYTVTDMKRATDFGQYCGTLQYERRMKGDTFANQRWAEHTLKWNHNIAQWRDTNSYWREYGSCPLSLLGIAK